MPTPLSELRTRVQVLYDVAGSGVLSSDEFDQLVNDAYRKLWRTVTRVNKDFRVSVDTFSLVAGTAHQRSFTIDEADNPPGASWAFANAAFTSADVGRIISPRFGSPNTAFNIDYTITGVLSPTLVNVTPTPAGGFTNPASGICFISAGQVRPLPTNYRETRLVRVDPGTENARILNRTTPRVGQSSWEREYRLEGSSLVIEPAGRCAGNYEHRYVPNVTPLVNDTDELDAELDQFAEFIVYDAADVALAREESERLYELDFQRAEKDVISWASSQRSADPDTVEDVRRPNRWGVGIP